MFPRRIVAFGASSILGRRDPDGGGFAGRLRRWHEPAHPNNVVYNLGIAGETTDVLLERFVSEVPRRRPQLIVMHFGINDTRRAGGRENPPARSLSDYCTTLETLLTQARQFADAFVIGQFPIDENRTAPYSDGESYFLLEDASAYTIALRDLCHKLNIPFLDLFAEWTPERIVPMLDDDGLHCNAAGHQRIFHRLRDRLESMYGPGGLGDRD